MQIYLYWLAVWLAPRVPLGVSYRLAEMVADFIWLFVPTLRARIEHNQKRALGPDATSQEVARSTRLALRNLTSLYVDEFRMPSLPDEALREMVEIKGLEHLEAARARGRGIVLASAHFGAVQIVSQVLTILGYPTTAVVEHVQPEEVFEFMSKLRRSRGIRLVPVDHSLLPLLRTLRKEKGLVGLAVDRNPTGSGVDILFLGEITRVPDGAVRLALRTGAALIVAYCRRVGLNRYEAVVQPPVELEYEGEERDATVRRGLVRLMARVESFIRQYPEQWVLTVPLGVERRASSVERQRTTDYL